MIGRRSGLPKRPYEKGIGWEFVDLAVFPAKDIVGQVGDMELDTQRGVFSLVLIGCSCVPALGSVVDARGGEQVGHIRRGRAG